jgi:lipopolysaccharide export system protein LptA
MTGAILLALALAAPGAKPALAAEGGKRSPVRVDADEVQYAFQKHEVTFSGKKPVVLTRDDATLTCRRMLAKTDEGGQIVSATCTGDVHFARGERVVTCDHAIFDEAAERVTCEGSPVLMKDAGSEARGAKLVYDLRADEAKLEGSPAIPMIITVPGVELERHRAGEQQRKKERAP